MGKKVLMLAFVWAALCVGNPLMAQTKTKAFRPYVGIGWGRGVPKNHRLGFAVDLGAQFWGTPKVYCQGNELKAEDVGNSDGGVMKTLTKVKVYPTLTFRLTGKIF